MKVKISEVWNGGSNGSETLAIIDVSPRTARDEVYGWIERNRPDLKLNTSINGHGFHAVAVD